MHEVLDLAAPLLSICIPTYNRPKELAETLRILAAEISLLSPEEQARIAVHISDNHSPDPSVNAVVSSFNAALPMLSYCRQSINVGPTRNFEACYQQARGKYVFLLSDDDHLTQGMLLEIVRCLVIESPAILFLPIHEHPAVEPVWQEFHRDEFLRRVSYMPTLISAFIVRRELIADSLGRYLDTNLHHYYYFLVALDRGDRFMALQRRALYCPYEDNAGGYKWFLTFAGQLPKILRDFLPERINHAAIAAVRRDLLLQHVMPIYFKRRMTGYTFNHNFKNESLRDVFGMIASNFWQVPAFYYAFLPLCFLPAACLRLIQRAYRAAKAQAKAVALPSHG